MSDDPEQLKQRIEELKKENQRLRESTTRRTLLRGGGVLAAVPALSLLFGSASAASGTLPAPSDPALTKFRGDRVRLVPRTSDVSNPDDGLVTYRGDL